MARKQKYLRLAIGLFMACILSVVIGCGGGGGSGGAGGGSGGTGGGGGTVGPFATTTTVSSGATKVAAGAAVTFTATVTGQGNPTGTVNICLANYCGMSTLVSGTATWTTSAETPGVYSVTAQYGGDSQNLSSTSAAISQPVTGSMAVAVDGQTGVILHISTVTVTLE